MRKHHKGHKVKKHKGHKDRRLLNDLEAIKKYEKDFLLNNYFLLHTFRF